MFVWVFDLFYTWQVNWNGTFLNGLCNTSCISFFLYSYVPVQFSYIFSFFLQWKYDIPFLRLFTFSCSDQCGKSNEITSKQVKKIWKWKLLGFQINVVYFKLGLKIQIGHISTKISLRSAQEPLLRSKHTHGHICLPFSPVYVFKGPQHHSLPCVHPASRPNESCVYLPPAAGKRGGWGHNPIVSRLREAEFGKTGTTLLRATLCFLELHWRAKPQCVTVT